MDFLHFLLEKDNIFIVAIVIVSGVMLLLPNLRRGRDGGGITSEAAIALVNQRQAIWVDVRSEEQFRAGHIAQARHAPAGESGAKSAALPKNRPLIVVGNPGRDTTQAVGRLREQGWTDVQVLKGGIATWTAAGLPLSHKA